MRVRTAIYYAINCDVNKKLRKILDPDPVES